MLTVADTPPRASVRRRQRLLTAIADPRNWRPADGRRPYRTAVAHCDLPPSVRTWAMWLGDRFDQSGSADVGVIVGLSQYSRRTTYRYLDVIERAGLVQRTSTSVRVGRREWRRIAVVRIADSISARQTLAMPGTPPLTCNSVTGDTTKGGSSVVSGTSSHLTTDRRLAPIPYEQPVSDQERDAVDNDWHRLAHARTDVPLLRPGYSENMTRDRWAADGEFTPPERREPEPARRQVDPAVAAAIAADPRAAMSAMLAGFGSLPDDVESRQR